MSITWRSCISYHFPLPWKYWHTVTFVALYMCHHTVSDCPKHAATYTLRTWLCHYDALPHQPQNSKTVQLSVLKDSDNGILYLRQCSQYTDWYRLCVWEVMVQFPAEQTCSSPQWSKWLWNPSKLMFNECWELFPWSYTSEGTKLTTQPLAKVKNKWSCTSYLTICLHGMYTYNLPFHT